MRIRIMMDDNCNNISSSSSTRKRPREECSSNSNSSLVTTTTKLPSTKRHHPLITQPCPPLLPQPQQQQQQQQQCTPPLDYIINSQIHGNDNKSPSLNKTWGLYSQYNSMLRECHFLRVDRNKNHHQPQCGNPVPGPFILNTRWASATEPQRRRQAQQQGHQGQQRRESQFHSGSHP